MNFLLGAGTASNASATNGISRWLKANRTAIDTIAPIVIGIVAIFALIFVLSKAIWAFKNGKGNDGLKQILFGAAIIIIASLGIVGLRALVNLLAGDSGLDLKDGRFDGTTTD